ncbi:hypothetical protein Dimus_020808, partial [Dionaea muscipula]
TVPYLGGLFGARMMAVYVVLIKGSSCGMISVVMAAILVQISMRSSWSMIGGLLLA